MLKRVTRHIQSPIAKGIAACLGLHGRRLRERRAAGHRLDPADQLARVERLDQVVVSARIEPLDALFRIVSRAQDDDRHFGNAAHRVTYAQRFFVATGGIHDEQIGAAFPPNSVRCFMTCSRRREIAVATQVIARRLTNVRVVDCKKDV